MGSNEFINYGVQFIGYRTYAAFGVFLFFTIVFTYLLVKNSLTKKATKLKSIELAVEEKKKELLEANNRLDDTRVAASKLEEEVEKNNHDISATSHRLDNIRGVVSKFQIQVDESKRELLSNEGQLKQIQSDLLTASNKLETVGRLTTELQQLKRDSGDMIKQFDTYNIETARLKKDIEHLKVQRDIYQSDYDATLSKLDLYVQIEEFSDQGHYQIPEYLYETSVRYIEEIKGVREQQKGLIKDKQAIELPSNFYLLIDKSVSKRALSGQVRLMLTAFNIECDLLISRVSPGNYSRTLERIEKLANSLEKSSVTLHCGFNEKYVELKFKECTLQYHSSILKQEEKEEQRLIREQIREEQKAIKEYERAVTQAEKEERMYRDLLSKARQELEESTAEERALTESKILNLEEKLAEAEAKEQRAKSMAEQTRKGHVYVISNIGSFGEGIYKIGLTRRLEPLDRVKELGDASVPFTFDVHAMIFVDDAPALEASLHKEFSNCRVNAVNYRKEFFRTDLKSIRETAERVAGKGIEFKMTALATDYYETRRLQGFDSISVRGA